MAPSNGSNGSDNNKGKLDHQVDDTFDLDNIEDLPSFVVPPTGSYLVTVLSEIEEKDINDDDYYTVKFEIKEVMEVTEKMKADEKEPVPGDQFDAIFNRTNKFGMGNFKTFVSPIAEHISSRKVGDIRAAAKGLDMLLIIRRTYDKDKDRHNFNIKQAAVA